MRLSFHSTRPRTRAAERGVALVVTIVLLSIITFLAIVFLALTGRETGSVKTSVNQTLAQQGADAGLERCKAELLSQLLASQGRATPGLWVSTNFVNWNGFDETAAPGFNQYTNVNYDYQVGGGQLGFERPNKYTAERNLTNLYYSPRVPVYITNRLVANSNEFRYYLDLNRNGRFDVTGLWPATNNVGQWFNTNGVPISVFNTANLLSNYVVGDPQWIGGLDRPNLSHGPENQFLYRYAYLALPVGNTLDINYIHNDAKLSIAQNGFFRNQGLGSWEINLAAFLRDLNTNYWSYEPYPLGYNTNLNQVSVGTAFDDAWTLWRYRESTGFGSVQSMYGAAGANALRSDFADSYSAGPLLESVFGYVSDPDQLNNTTGLPWPGADMQNHFFTIQDLFDPAKARIGVGVGVDGFPERLAQASTNISTYDQETYYRLLAQLGTDSAPEDPSKLNLDYVNVGGLAATNFVRWTDPDLPGGNPGRGIPAFGVPNSILFYTNAVDRMLRTYTAEWFRAGPSNYLATFFGYYGYTNVNEVGLTNRPYFGMTNEVPTFGIGDIPVVVPGTNFVYGANLNRTGPQLMVYRPAVHRVLQLAANIWDCLTNRTDLHGALPTIFRPRFTVLPNNTVCVADFDECRTYANLTDPNSLIAGLSPSPSPEVPGTNGLMIDLMSVTNAYLAIPANGRILVYGVPPIVGARKGLPNFNEFRTENAFTLTRKIQVHKKAANQMTETNQFFTMSVTMPTGVEFWNSYSSNYTRPVSIYITNLATMTMTNDLGVNFTKSFLVGERFQTNLWPGFYETAPVRSNFIVMLRDNLPFQPTVGYLPNLGATGFVAATNTHVFDTSQNLIMPRWGIKISNRIHAMVLDQLTDEIIDFAMIGGMDYYTNLTDAVAAPLTGSGDPFDQLWATNALPSNPSLITGRRGIEMQILISRGAQGGVDLNNGRWRSFGKFEPNDVANAVANFNLFLTGTTTNLLATVPFTPSVQFYVPMVWQANDPLVHYQADDLFYQAGSTKAVPITPENSGYTGVMTTIGTKNERYRPWPKNATAPAAGNLEARDNVSPDFKDPLLTSSDEWQFPTNALPTIGWLGRIHRGTPWQSVYLKARDVGGTMTVPTLNQWLANLSDKSPSYRWATWTGNRYIAEGHYNRPAEDRLLFDVFTTTWNDNAARGRLPINQTGLAAWSALFSGMVALTNAPDKLSVKPVYTPMIIEPAGVFDISATNNWPPLVKIVDSINRVRTNLAIFPSGTFEHVGDILAVPELTDASPFLNQSGSYVPYRGLTDAAYEWLPQQMMSLVTLGQPRFVIYSYGQALQPAPDSIIDGGPYSGLCTNYAITAEVAMRAVVRVEGSANPKDANNSDPKHRYPPHVVVESYNPLGPD